MAAPSDRAYISELPQGTDEAKAREVFGAYGTIKTCVFMAQKRAAIVQFESTEEAQWVVDNLNGNIPQNLSTPVKVEFAQPQAQKGAAAKGTWSAAAAATGAQEKGGKQAQRSEPYGGKSAWGQKGAWGQADSWSQKGGQEQKGSCGGKGWGGEWGGKSCGGKKGGSARAMKKGLEEAGVLPGGKWSNDENALYVGGLPGDMTDLDLYNIFSPFGAIPYRGVAAMVRPDGSCKGFGFVNFLSSEAAKSAITALNGVEAGEGGTALVVMVKAPAGPVSRDGVAIGEANGASKGNFEAKGKGKGGW